MKNNKNILVLIDVPTMFLILVLYICLKQISHPKYEIIYNWWNSNYSDLIYECMIQIFANR